MIYTLAMKTLLALAIPAAAVLAALVALGSSPALGLGMLAVGAALLWRCVLR
ncbi:MAG: hypothetical protein U1A72_01530 [Sulfuritalea sp.]|nr:hypothetical protein [Sulfuritalea sp.]